MEIRDFLSSRYLVCTKAIIISKGSYGNVEPKSNFCVGAKSALPSTGLQTKQFHAAPNRDDNGNLRKFGASFLHGTVFALRQS